MNRRTIPAIILVAAVFLVVLFLAQRNHTPAVDSSAFPCNEFRAISSDESQGLLTDAELRSKLQGLRADTVNAPAALQTDATQAVAADTAGDSVLLQGAMTKLGEDCAGH